MSVALERSTWRYTQVISATVMVAQLLTDSATEVAAIRVSPIDHYSFALGSTSARSIALLRVLNENAFIDFDCTVVRDSS